jgi:type I restriction enzyme, S subunit
MSEWIEKPLNQLVTFQKGRKVDTSSFCKDGYSAYLGASGIEGREDGYGDPKFGVIAKPSDTLMLWDGERSGLVGFGQHGVVASTVSKLSPNESVDPQYLYFSLLAKFDWIQHRRTGTGVPHVPKDLGRILKVSFPKRKTVQAKIAAILATIDTAIEQTEALIEKYQHIKAGLMHDLFTRGVLPTGQLRPPRDQAPELYQETAIGWIPREWEVSGLAAKGRAGTSWIRTGPFGSSLKGEHWRLDGHPVITIGALGAGEFIQSELLFVGTKDASRLIDFQLKENDVVFSRVADVGRSVVVREAQAGWIMSSNLMRIAVNETLLRPDYLQMQLASDSRVKSQIRASVNSGGRDVANSEVLNRLRFAIPEPAEQDQIIAMANRLTQRMSAEMRRVAKLQSQKFGLMQDLLTGKVAVSASEE